MKIYWVAIMAFLAGIAYFSLIQYLVFSVDPESLVFYLVIQMPADFVNFLRLGK